MNLRREGQVVVAAGGVSGIGLSIDKVFASELGK